MATVTLATCHTGYGITGGINPGLTVGFDFTADMLAWAEAAHGMDLDDPDVHVEVSVDAEMSTDVEQAIAWTEWEVPAGQADAVRAACAEYEARRADAFGPS